LSWKCMRFHLAETTELLNLVMEMHAVPLAKMKGLPKNPPDPENGNKGGFPTFF